MGYTVLEAKVRLLSESEGGRKSPIFTGYSPNHRFDENSYYIGLIELDDGQKLFPGQECKCKVKMLDSPGCQERLNIGYKWQITEGVQVVGDIEILAIIDRVEIE